VLLAARGERVLVLERAAAAGGKMRQLLAGGRLIDAGPTVLTMRWVFENLFADAGQNLADHVMLEPLAVLARHAWSASEQLDLHADVQASADAIGRFSGADEARRFLVFSAEARRIYQTLETPFIKSQRPGPVRLATSNGFSGLRDMLRINPFETMWAGLGRHFKDLRLRQLFGRYATYCGSSPFQAPATLMLVAHVEKEGVWAVKGGMHSLAQALAALAMRHGAEIRYRAEVASIEVHSGAVGAVKLATGEVIACRDVIVNADVNAVATGLLGARAARTVEKVPPDARSLSAITWAATARTSGFPLSRHNVFFSGDYASEFGELKIGYPRDPTVYICAQDRDDPVEGEERLLVLVNSPANGDGAPVPHAGVEHAMRTRLEACGLAIDWQQDKTIVTTPSGFGSLFPATGGALYGRASHGWMASFRRPGAATSLPGLYLAGGSVHPGPGVPMAALSGRLAAESLMASRASTPWSRRAAIAGGTSTA
jgi:1-hydroxycarotenoid 3,4-desaturase